MKNIIKILPKLYKKEDSMLVKIYNNEGTKNTLNS